MCYEERNAIASLFSTFIVSMVFGLLLWRDYSSGAFEASDGLGIWAQTIVWMVPAAIIICITSTVAIHIIYSVVKGSSDLPTLTDERDQMIGKMGMHVTFVTASLGFITAIIALSFGWSALAGLNIILAGFVAGDLIGNLAKIAAYRFGL